MGRKHTEILPEDLVADLCKIADKKQSGNFPKNFILCMNDHIDLLLYEKCITKLKGEEIVIDVKDTIENGSVSPNVIINAVGKGRNIHRGKRKLIKAIIIGCYGQEWRNVFNRYYDSDGNLKKDEALSNENKNTGVIKLLKTNALSNWNTSANFSTPQWASFHKIPTENGLIKRIQCQLVTISEYYRFGFKLFKTDGRLFGDGSIQSQDSNFLIHLGKNFLSPKLFITTYHNGIRQRPDKYTDATPQDYKIGIELRIDDENLLHFMLNDQEVFQKNILKEIRSQIYMLAWGDGNEFQISVKHIEIEYEIE